MTAGPPNSPPPTLTLDQVVALHDEMAALVRAGVPLERGLADLSSDLPSNLRHITQQIGERLERGEELGRIFSDPNTGIPPAYRVVIEAGTRSGRLAAALEDVATSARRAIETRRAVGLALVYPVVIATLAYLLLIGAVTFFVPRLAEAYQELGLSSNLLLQWLTIAGESVVVWALWPPIVGIVGLWFYWRGMSNPGPWDRGRGVFTRFSPAQVARLSGLATLADLLGLLIAHEVPLPDSLVLAAQATGRACWIASSEEIARRLRQGECPSAAMFTNAGYPPIVGWMLSNDSPASMRCASLRDAARSYRDRAKYVVDGLTAFLPIALGAIIGGTTVLAYALIMLSPYFDLLRQLGRPS